VLGLILKLSTKLLLSVSANTLFVIENQFLVGTAIYIICV